MPLRQFYASYFDPAEPQLRRLRMDQLRQGAQNTLEVGPGFLFVVAVVALTNMLWSPAWMCIAWAASVFAARRYSSRVSRQIVDRAHDERQLAHFATRLIFGSAAVIALMASGCIMLWAHGEPANHLFWGLICGAGALMVAAQTAPFLPHGLCSFIYVGVFSAAAMSEGKVAYAAISLTSLCCGVLIWGILKSLNTLSTRTLTLARDKDELVEKLMMASKAKSDFLANMSHELRTPLNAIIGFSDVMRQETFGPLGSKQYGGYAGDIHMSGQHLLSLINDILDLSKIEAGKFELRDDLVDLHDLARDAARLVAPKADGAGVDLRIDTHAGTTLHGDERALKQCLVNLLTNAVKFTPKGGEVRVHARRDETSLRIDVTDTGCGIHPDDLDKVFESFAQAQNQNCAHDRGTGLGLPIVRGLVRAHGGEVTLASELGRGTTVTVALPASRLAAPCADSAAA
jgi:signal transduction histidine kinase